MCLTFNLVKDKIATFDENLTNEVNYEEVDASCFFDYYRFEHGWV